MNFDKFHSIIESRLNYGQLEDANVVSEYTNVGCGDAYHLYLKINPKNVIQDAKYTTTGCSFSLVSLGILCELIKGKHINFIDSISYPRVEEFIDGYPERRKNYIDTVLKAGKKAIQDFQNGTGLDINTILTSKKIYRIIQEKGNLANENLSQSYLEDINMKDIDMNGVNLQNTFLCNSNLENSNLSNSRLLGTFFNNCNLKNANLQNADIRFAKFDGANLDGADFTNAIYDTGTKIDRKYIGYFKVMQKKGKDIYIKKQT